MIICVVSVPGLTLVSAAVLLSFNLALFLLFLLSSALFLFLQSAALLSNLVFAATFGFLKFCCTFTLLKVWCMFLLFKALAKAHETISSATEVIKTGRLLFSQDFLRTSVTWRELLTGTGWKITLETSLRMWCSLVPKCFVWELFLRWDLMAAVVKVCTKRKVGVRTFLSLNIHVLDILIERFCNRETSHAQMIARQTLASLKIEQQQFAVNYARKEVWQKLTWLFLMWVFRFQIFCLNWVVVGVQCTNIFFLWKASSAPLF